MQRTLLWLIVVLLVVIAFMLYRRSGSRLDVTPDAGRSIERAKHR